MNTAQGDKPNYDRMMRVLDAYDGPLDIQIPETERGFKNDMHRGGYRKNRIIDFIFCRYNGHEPQSVFRSAPQIQSKWSRKHIDLSDHFPVAIKIVW